MASSFVDKARISIHAGRGGDGAVSFHREKYIAAGGPDGGDGGKGGNVVFRVDDHMSTLMDFRYKRKYVAGAGMNGQGKRCFGKDGETLYIKVRIADAVKGTTRSMTLSTGYPTMEFLSGGKGIAFGKVADAEGFHCAMDAVFSGKVMDAQGRTWVARYDLTAVTGMYLTPIYGRVLELLGAGFLQLKFTCNRNRAAGDLLFTADLPLTEDITVTDTTGKVTLTLTPAGVVTPASLPTGTYTFSCLLY